MFDSSSFEVDLDSIIDLESRIDLLDPTSFVVNGTTTNDIFAKVNLYGNLLF